MPITPEGRKISEYDLAGTLSGAEYFPLVQGGQTKKAQLNTINAFNDGSCKCTLVSRDNTVGNDANTLEKYLQTYTLEGNTLVNDGEYIVIEAWGETGNNADNKRVNFYFGSSSYIPTYDTFENQSTVWRLVAKVKRLTATTQKILYQFDAYLSGVTQVTNTAVRYIIPGSETLTQDIQISISGQSGTATSDNVTIEDFTIELHKLDPDS